MASLIRSYEWKNTSIGSFDKWPTPLLTLVNQILDSSCPMFIWWGKERIQFYNDAYLKILGTDSHSKHPIALGQNGENCWPEIWPKVSPILDSVLQTGHPVFLEDQPIPIHRNGLMDNLYWTFSYNIIRYPDGSAGGILVVCTETTSKVNSQTSLLELNEELAASNEELLGANSDLLDSRASLADLNQSLEETIKKRTVDLQTSEHLSFIKSRRLSAIVENVPAGLAILTSRNMILETANEYMLNLWRKDKNSFGLPLIEFLPEMRDQSFPALLDEVYTTGTTYTNKDARVELIREGKREVVYMDFSYTPLSGDDNQTECILVLAQDVTERTLSSQREQELLEELGSINEELASSNEELISTIEELASSQKKLEENISLLETSEARFQNLIKDISAGVIVLTGEDHRIVIVNDAYASLIGRTAAELYLKPLFEIIPEAEFDFRHIIEKVQRNGQSVYLSDEPYSVCVNGVLKTGYLDLAYQPFRESGNEISGVMVLCQDVTEKVLARLEMRKKDERFGFMLDSIPQQVWTATPEGNLDYVNSRTSEEFGRSVSDIIGDGWQAFIHEDDLPGAMIAWNRALLTGEEYQVEFRLKFADGKYYWHLARARPLKDAVGISLWFGTNTNIEHQKENERRKDEFISIASHELKTPLTSIKAFNQLLRRTQDALRTRQLIDRFSTPIERLEKIISDLLDVTKINSGKMAYDIQPFNFAEMITDCTESLKPTLEKHTLIIASNADISYTGDRFRLEQVINNFLGNAVKYSPDGGQIILDSKIEGRSIVVSIQDFGIGIEAASLDKLFDRYYRVDNTSMQFEGIGLGLYISSEILKRHKGTFWIESKTGQGSTFFFRLPLDKNKANSEPDQGDFHYHNEQIAIDVNNENNILEVNWTNFQDMDSVQHGGMMMLDLLRKNNCRKVLNDNREVLGTWSDASDWAGKEWFPRMEQAGLKYFAWIFSTSTFSQLSAKKSVDVMNGDVTVRFFTDLQEAKAWLLNAK